MKKLLLSLTLFAGFTATAQVDTLSEFFTGTPALYLAQPGGYLTGTNGYGDLSKAMRFNNQTGVTSGGTITSVLACIPVKNVGNPNTVITATIRNFADTNNYGSIIGTSTITLGAIDTSAAAYGTAAGRPYNVVFNFASAVAIPASNDFMVVITVPNSANDSIAILSNSAGDFGLAYTHSFEEWNPSEVHSFGHAYGGGANIALAIYPVVNFTNSIEENITTASVYPNPVNDVVNFEVSEEIASIVITSLDGKVIATTTNTTLNVSDFNSGMYLYTLNTVSGKVANGSFTKN